MRSISYSFPLWLITGCGRSFPCYPAGPCSFILHVPFAPAMSAIPPSKHLLLLLCLHISSPSPSWQPCAPAPWDSGESWRLNDVYFLQTRHWKGTQKDFCAQESYRVLPGFPDSGQKSKQYPLERQRYHIYSSLFASLFAEGIFYPHCSEMRKHWPCNLAGVTHLVRWLGHSLGSLSYHFKNFLFSS